MGEIRLTNRTHFAATIGAFGIHGILPRDGWPVCLIIYLRMVLGVYDGGRGRRDDDSPYGWGMRQYRMEKPGCSLDGRVQEVFHGVLHVEVVRRCRVDHVVEGFLAAAAIGCRLEKLHGDARDKRDQH